MGSEMILLADDEPMLRRVAKLMLQQDGYRVIEAEDGLEAAELFEAHCDEIDLVLLDVTMPGLDGPRALERIREVKPEVPAVMASGLPDLADSLPDGPTGFLAKPFDAESLIRSVRSMLDREY